MRQTRRGRIQELIYKVFFECSGDLIIPEYLQYLKSLILLSNEEISNFSDYKLNKIYEDLQNLEILCTSKEQQKLYDKLRDEKITRK